MKVKVTRKQIRAENKPIIKVPYCELQLVLYFENPQYYITRREGWAADVYDIGEAFIVTGYAPFGDITPTPKLVAKYTLAADKIRQYYDFDATKAARRTHELVHEFVNEALKEGGAR